MSNTAQHIATLENFNANVGKIKVKLMNDFRGIKPVSCIAERAKAEDAHDKVQHTTCKILSRLAHTINELRS